MKSILKNEKWDRRYLGLAQYVSQWSKDPGKQVGAIITQDNYHRGTGFNGFPRGIADTKARLNDKEIKLLIVIHAEVNAIIDAQGRGDTIYVYPCLPCAQCLGQIIQTGIKRVVTLPLDLDSKWNQGLVMELANEAGITVDTLTFP